MNTDIITITPPDTLTKVQAELAAVAEKISNSSTEELLSELVDKAVSFGLKVMAAVAIYIIGAWLIRKLKKVIGKIFEKKNTDAAIASFIQSIISIALTVVLVIITVGALGIDTTSIAALLAGGGMAIGLALNGTVQNFAGGIMILVFRPFKSGDYIQAQGFEGIVTEVNIVSTKLTTVDNKCVVIPNGSLSNGTINNFSQNDLRRLSWNVDVEYGSSSDLTKEVMLELMKNDKRILTTADGAPADPFVALSELSSSSVKFVMRAWVRAEDYWDVNFDMNESIYKELPKKGIMFPYQKLDVTILKYTVILDNNTKKEVKSTSFFCVYSFSSDKNVVCALLLFEKFFCNDRICIYIKEYVSEILPVDFRLYRIKLSSHIICKLLCISRVIHM